AAPFAEFSNQQFSLFLQDTWNASRGLDVMLGLRYDLEQLDDEEVNRN
ncbi:MAG: TonB-dependent receptor, partial [Acidobacteria bacterium]|nr:TonB-dependent receptor [Acidobacteriota bacterium]NIQ29062.1 TonB-dependent receptor [Acidobacteriota bacterium]